MSITVFSTIPIALINGLFLSFLSLARLYKYVYLLFRAEHKPRGYYLEHFWQADLGYIGQAIIGVKVPNSSHVASIQH